MVDETKKKHEQIDPVFKQILEERFASYKAVCQTEVEVGRLPRKIDALISIENEDELQKICEETAFFYFAKDNQIEFKGRHDPLTKDEYHHIQGRKHFLLGRQQISAFAMTVTIISAGKPRNVLDYAQKRKRPFVPVPEEAGYYRCDEYPSIYLIVANELPLTPKHYPLLVFASSERKFREFLAQVIVEGESVYIRYAYEVRPRVTKEVLTMAGIGSTLSREDLEFMAEDIGPELVPFLKPQDLFKGMGHETQRRLLSLFSPEERLADLSPEERLADLSPKERLADLSPEERLADLSPEERLADLSIEEFLKGISPEKQKALWDSLLKIYMAPAPDEKQTNGGKH